MSTASTASTAFEAAAASTAFEPSAASAPERPAIAAIRDTLIVVSSSGAADQLRRTLEELWLVERWQPSADECAALGVTRPPSTSTRSSTAAPDDGTAATDTATATAVPAGAPGASTRAEEASDHSSSHSDAMDDARASLSPSGWFSDACVWPSIVTRAGLYRSLYERLDDAPPLLDEFAREVLLQRAAADAVAAGDAPPFEVRPGLVPEMLALYDALRRQHRTIDDFERLVGGALEAGAEIDRGARRLLQQTGFLVSAFRAYEARLAAGEELDEHGLRARLLERVSARPIRRVIVAVPDQRADATGLWPADFDLLTRIPGLDAIDIVATEALLGTGYIERLFETLPGIEVHVMPDVEAPSPLLLAPRADGRQDPLHFTSRDREQELADAARRLRRAATPSPSPSFSGGTASSSPSSSPSSFDRMAVVYQRPLPYLYLARQVFGAYDLPWQAFDALPLAAEPYAAALDLVITFALSGCTRAAGIALLRAPQFRFDIGGREPTLAEIAACDAELRAAGFLGGRDRLQALLDAWRADEAPPAASLAARGPGAVDPAGTGTRHPAGVADHEARRSHATRAASRTLALPALAALVAAADALEDLEHPALPSAHLSVLQRFLDTYERPLLGAESITQEAAATPATAATESVTKATTETVPAAAPQTVTPAAPHTAAPSAMETVTTVTAQSVTTSERATRRTVATTAATIAPATTADTSAAMTTVAAKTTAVTTALASSPDGAWEPLVARHRRARAAVVGTLTGLRLAFAEHGEREGPFRDLAALVHRWLEGQTFSPRVGEQGLHLVDVQAAMFGRFTHVALVGVVESEWPAASSRSIFYPATLLRDLGWPPEAERRAAARAVFDDLLRLARDEVSVSVFALEHDAIVRPSPFVEDLSGAGLRVQRVDDDIAGAVAVAGAGAGVAPGTAADSVADDRLLTVPALTIEPDERAAWATLRRARSPIAGREFHGWTGAVPPRTYSVTGLDRYLQCPFRYFAAHVLRLEEEPERRPGLTPLERGRFEHEVFQLFFTRWDAAGRGAIDERSLDAARAEFLAVVDDVLAKLPASERELERARLLGSAVSAGLGERVFRFEAARLAPIAERLLEYPLDGEYELTVSVSVPASVSGSGDDAGTDDRGSADRDSDDRDSGDRDGGDRIGSGAVTDAGETTRTRTIRLRGIADRIDLLADGTVRVIDYKTGKASSAASSIQLPVYAHCAEERLEGYRGRRWRVSEAGYLAFGRPEPFVPVVAPGDDVRKKVTQAVAAVVDVVDRIEEGAFPVTPAEPHNCIFCGFSAVCRKDYVEDV